MRLITQTVSMKSMYLLNKVVSSLVMLSLAYALSVNAAEISQHAETASGLQGWLISDGNIEIQLNPLLRDQVRAFYLARGFSDEVTQQIEISCVFQAVMSNVSVPADENSVSVDLSQWIITTPKGATPLKDKDSWLHQWSEMGASDTSNVAFRWATFPWEQTFVQSGDYGWGMILLGKNLPDHFKLMAAWSVAGQPQSQLVDGLSCPD